MTITDPKVEATMERWERILTGTLAVSNGLVAGVFFAFSVFVMTGLRYLPAAAGIRAMNGINKAAPTPLFMIVLFGTALASIVLLIPTIRHLDGTSGGLRLIACLLAVVPVVVTVVYHVPHNDALMAYDPNSVGAAEHWRTWATAWTQVNHVRTISALAASALLTIAVRLP